MNQPQENQPKAGKPQLRQPWHKPASDEFLKSIYEQHWLHARHVENERLWFTNIFGVVVAGLLAFLGNQGISSNIAILAGSFILILSLLGYSLYLTWRAPFLEHTTLVNKLLEDTKLKEYVSYTSEAYRGIKIGWLTAHELFLYFYALMAGNGCFWIIFWGVGKGAVTSPFLLISIGISIIPSLVLCWLWRGWFRKREVAYRHKMGVREW